MKLIYVQKSKPFAYHLMGTWLLLLMFERVNEHAHCYGHTLTFDCVTQVERIQFNFRGFISTANSMDYTWQWASRSCSSSSPGDYLACIPIVFEALQVLLRSFWCVCCSPRFPCRTTFITIINMRLIANKYLWKLKNATLNLYPSSSP